MSDIELLPCPWCNGDDIGAQFGSAINEYDEKIDEAINGYFWFGLLFGLLIGHLLSGWLFHNGRKNDAHRELPGIYNDVRSAPTRATRHAAALDSNHQSKGD